MLFYDEFICVNNVVVEHNSSKKWLIKHRISVVWLYLLRDDCLYLGTFSKYYKISQLIHTQNVAN